MLARARWLLRNVELPTRALLHDLAGATLAGFSIFSIVARLLMTRRAASTSTTETGIQTSIDAGTDSIEHGDAVTEQMLKQRMDKGIFFDLTVTFAGGRLREFVQKSVVLSPEDEQKLAQYEERLNREARGSHHTMLHRSGR